MKKRKTKERNKDVRNERSKMEEERKEKDSQN